MGLPDIDNIPDSGAVFTIGRSRFADNIASHFFIRKDPVVNITCGDEHSAVVCESGRLFVFGSNNWGQLGLGHKSHVSKPSCVKILKPEKVTHVACGRAHTLICIGNQKIFACGSDQEVQLGRGSSAIGDSSSSPVLVHDVGLVGPRIIQIAAGSQHSMVLTNDGSVMAWGSNLEGQLGLSGTSGLANKPMRVPISEPVKQICAGYYHSAFLTESGLVYVCGESESGKLGIDVSFSTQVAPKLMQLPSPAVRVACGGHHTLVLANDGNIYCVGSNTNGQLGMGTNVTEITTPKLFPCKVLKNDPIVKIACGESHSAILTASGKLFMCGDGRHGKLGLEENENNVHTLTLAAKYHELFITDVSCGGCHTILVGRRHELKDQINSTAESDSSTVAKNSLPPLKLSAMNRLQNEHSPDKTEETTNKSSEGEKTLPHIVKDEEISHTNDTLDKIAQTNGNDTNENESLNMIKNVDQIKTEATSMDEQPKSNPNDDSNKNTIEKIDQSNEENNTTDTNQSNINENEKHQNESSLGENTIVDTMKNVIAKPLDKIEEGVNKLSGISTSTMKIVQEGVKKIEMDVTNNNDLSNMGKDIENHVDDTVEKVKDQISATTEMITHLKNNDEIKSNTEQQKPATPPPKPPRQKLGSIESSYSEEMESLMKIAHSEDKEKITTHKECENNSSMNDDDNLMEDDGVIESIPKPQSPERSNSNKLSANSRTSKIDTERTIVADAQKIIDDKLKTDENLDEIEPQPDIIPNDAIVPSPVTKTGRVANFFKSRRQTGTENGTKSNGTANPKAKSKTCTVL